MRLLWRPGSSEPGVRISSPLPLPHRIQRIQQHQDVQQQVVADHVADAELHRDRQRDGRPDRQPRGQQEAAHHRGDVADGIDDAVAVVVERDRRFAIAIDDEVGVLENLPPRLDYHGKPPAACRSASAARAATPARRTRSRG